MIRRNEKKQQASALKPVRFSWGFKGSLFISFGYRGDFFPPAASTLSMTRGGVDSGRGIDSGQRDHDSGQFRLFVPYTNSDEIVQSTKNFPPLRKHIKGNSFWQRLASLTVCSVYLEASHTVLQNFRDDSYSIAFSCARSKSLKLPHRMFNILIALSIYEEKLTHPPPISVEKLCNLRQIPGAALQERERN